MVDRKTSAKGVRTGVGIEELSRRYNTALLRYFVRRGIAQQDAQDLVQDVFARLSRHDALDNVGSVDGYLFATSMTC